MSSFTLSTLFSSDVLDVCEMKPWWEKIRAFLLFLTCGVQIFLAFDVGDSPSIDCISRNDSVKLSAAETKYWNGVCALEITWWMVNFRFVNIILGVFTFGIYALWPMIPRVRQTFMTLRRCDTIINELKLTEQEIKEVVKSICFTVGHPGKRLAVTDKDASSIASVCIDLWCYDTLCPLSVKTLYHLRNVLASVPIALSLYSLAIVASNNDRSTFSCVESGNSPLVLSCFHGHQTQIRTPLYSLMVLEGLLGFCNLLASIFLAREFLIRYICKGTTVVHLASLSIFICRLVNMFSMFGQDVADDRFILITVMYCFSIMTAAVVQWQFLVSCKFPTKSHRRRWDKMLPCLFCLLTSIIMKMLFLVCSTDTGLVASMIFSIVYILLNAYIFTRVKGTRRRQHAGLNKTLSKCNDNKFVVSFAESATPLQSGIKGILFPEELKIYETDETIRKLKSKTFLHPKEKVFSELRSLQNGEINELSISEIIAKHKILFSDEWAREKLKTTPGYCGCASRFAELPHSEVMFLVESLLKQTDSVDDVYMRHVSDALSSRKFHDCLMSAFEDSFEARRAMEQRLQRIPEWFDVDFVRKGMHDLCQNSTVGNDRTYDRYIFAHYIMTIGGYISQCGCKKLLKKMQLDDLDEEGRSFLYYLLSDLERFPLHPRLKLIEYILKNLQQPTALLISEAVYHDRNGCTIQQYSEQNFSNETQRELKIIIDRITETRKSDEIENACRNGLRDQYYARFISFHTHIIDDNYWKNKQLGLEETPCRFCGREIHTLENDEDGMETGKLLKLIWKANPNLENKLFLHVLVQLGFKQHDLGDRVILSNQTNLIIRIKSSKLDLIYPAAHLYDELLNDLISVDRPSPHTE